MKIRDRIKEFRRVKASELIPHPQNWRLHPESQQNALRAILAEVGYVDAIMARETPDGLQIIDGHLRAETTPDTEVPVLVVDLDDEEAKKVLATFDPISGLAGTDEEMLQRLLDDLEFESDILEHIGLDDTPVQAMAPDDPGVVAAPESPVSEIGDVWVLGKHVIVCGDSTSINPKSAFGVDTKNCLLFFDPPWDLEVEIGFNQEFSGALAFSDGRRSGQLVSQFGPPSWVFVWDCVSSWYTPNRPLQRAKFCFWYGDLNDYDFDGSHYGTPLEPKKVTNTRGTFEFVPDPRGKHLSDVFSSPITREHAGDTHPHSKPVDWVRMLIANCSRMDVFDPFLGSGTSLVAAEQLGRICYGVEIDPRHVDASVVRWQMLTGREASTVEGKTIRGG